MSAKRSIRVTGGFSGEVELTLTDRKGLDLSAADFKIGLVPVDADAPDEDSPTWQNPASEGFPRLGQVALTMRPTSAHALGLFRPAALVYDSGRPPELIVSDDYVELT